LLAVAVDAFTRPVQTSDVIVHRRLDRVKVRSAHTLVSHYVPTTLLVAPL
jgi:hypothetical protein